LAAETVATAAGFKLGPDVGFGIGLNLADSANRLSSTNDLLVQTKSTFVIDLAFSDVEFPESESDKVGCYFLLLV